MNATTVKVMTGDIFESEAQTLINTVNCRGVMGKGVALEFKRRFGAMYDDYRLRCARNQVKLGQPYIYKGLMPPWIINFPTKDNWREASRLSAISDGLRWIKDHLAEWHLESLASPPLGCGQGQLDWRVVGPVLYHGFLELGIPVTLFAPHGTPKDQMHARFLRNLRPVRSTSPAAPQSQVSPAFVALVETMRRIAETRFYYPGAIEVMKIAYFATVLGIPTNLEFSEGSYGPFSGDLKREVAKLVQNGLLVQETRGKATEHQVGPAFQQSLWADHLKRWHNQIDRLKDLFLRLRNARQAELYATVHFAATRIAEPTNGAVDEIAVLKATQEWKRGKQDGFTEQEIGDAIRILHMLEWLPLRYNAQLPVSEHVQHA